MTARTPLRLAALALGALAVAATGALAQDVAPRAGATATTPPPEDANRPLEGEAAARQGERPAAEARPRNRPLPRQREPKAAAGS